MAEKDILMHVRREDSGVPVNDYTVLYPKTLERLVVDENGITLKDKMNTKLDKVLYTPEDILTKIKIVDGEGSGLDADTVDGLHAASFLPKIGTSIPAGADLDNYVTIGEYYCANNTVAAEVVHSPYPWGFYLEIRYIGIDGLVMQRWTSCNGSTMAIRYRKNLESYEWTDWAEYRAQTSGTWTPYLLANNVQISGLNYIEVSGHYTRADNIASLTMKLGFRGIDLTPYASSPIHIGGYTGPAPAESSVSTWIGGCTMMGGYTEKALGAVIYPNGIIAIANPEIAHLLYENIPYYNNSTANHYIYCTFSYII